jgi:hypothetical protein
VLPVDVEYFKACEAQEVLFKPIKQDQIKELLRFYKIK